MRRPGLKSKSARQTLHQKHKIDRKIKEHNRKQRKALKKGEKLNKGSRFTKRTRDPGIPNNCPFRDEILKEAQAFKEKQEKEKEEMKDKQRKWQQLQFKRKQQGFSSVEEMLEKAEKDKQKHEQKEREKIENLESGSDRINSDLAKGKRESQNFWRQVNQVINEADVILHILDARDPEGTRCKQIEKAVSLRDDKKLVLVLNKIDLVPLEAAKAWLSYYRRTMGPTIGFKATTQQQRHNISQKGSGGKMAKEVSGTKAICLGVVWCEFFAWDELVRKRWARLRASISHKKKAQIDTTPLPHAKFPRQLRPPRIRRQIQQSQNRHHGWCCWPPKYR